MSAFKSIGKFDVVGKIGEGSFGVVYRGFDPFLKRDVAIKVCSVADDGLRQRFAREGQISGNLHHRNIVTVFAYGHEGEIPYLVQEYLSGEDLDQVIKRRAPLLPAEKLDYLLQIAEGMAYAHQQDIIHRDIKPANIRVLDDGQVKVMDFGIAKLASAETQLTRKGVTLGTASYLPPEQVRGGEVDLRADVFSFGVLAYELFAYERPFRGNTLSALVYQILYKMPLPLSSLWDGCPEALADLVAHCLEKKAERRAESFDVLIPRLKELKKKVEAGEWPELLKVPTLTGSSGASAGKVDSGEVLSQSLIQRTAENVGQAGDATRIGGGDQTIAVAGLAGSLGGGGAPPPDDDSTQPVPDPNIGAATVRIDKIDPLGERGREIAELVSTGQFQQAMQQLEQTMELHQTPDGELAPKPDGPDSVLESVPDAEIPTTVLPESTEGSPQPHAPEPTASVDPVNPSHASRTPIPPPPPLATAPPPAAPPPVANRPSPGSPSHPQRTSVKPATSKGRKASSSALPRQGLETLISSHKRLLGGLAAALALIVVAVLFLGRTPDEAVTAPPEPQPSPATVETPPPPMVVVTPTGGVILDARPWAELVSITNEDGSVVDLPENPFTPIYLQLPPGHYSIVLQHPDFPEDPRICEAEVGPDLVASCDEVFGVENATEYFKEAAWWE